MQIDGRTRPRVLVVVDWTVDPDEVVAALARRADEAIFVVTVPAWLHGLDWVGDPTASAPCAQRQADAVEARSRARGLEVAAAEVGDPDVASAIGDALHAHGAAEVVLFTRRRRFHIRHPWDLARRTQRATGLQVRAFALSLAPGSGGSHRRPFLRGRHCEADALQAA